MPNEGVTRVTQSISRSLTRAKPEQVKDVVGEAVNQAFGAYVYANAVGETKAAGILRLLHKDLMEVDAASPEDRASYLEGLLRRWK